MTALVQRLFKRKHYVFLVFSLQFLFYAVVFRWYGIPDWALGSIDISHIPPGYWQKVVLLIVQVLAACSLAMTATWFFLHLRYLKRRDNPILAD